MESEQVYMRKLECHLRNLEESKYHQRNKVAKVKISEK